MIRLLRAYPTLLRVGLAEAVAYRAEMFVWMLTTTMPLVSLALWHTVAAGGTIAGYAQRDLVGYFLAALIVRQLTGSWVVWEMNQEIKRGTLSLRLLRPLHPLIAYSAENLAALPLRGALALPIAVVMLFTVGGARFTHDPVIVVALLLAIAGAWLITFLVMCAIGTLGFFMESSTSVFEVWLGAFFVLSGYTLPLQFFAARAPWLLTLARRLPFYYTLGFPIELLLGQHPSRADALSLLGIQWAWVAGFFVVATGMWRLGMRRWNAYGA